MIDLLSISAFAADQLIRPTAEFSFTFLRYSADGFIVEIDSERLGEFNSADTLQEGR